MNSFIRIAIMFICQVFCPIIYNYLRSLFIKYIFFTKSFFSLSFHTPSVFKCKFSYQPRSLTHNAFLVLFVKISVNLIKVHYKTTEHQQATDHQPLPTSYLSTDWLIDHQAPSTNPLLYIRPTNQWTLTHGAINQRPTDHLFTDYLSDCLTIWITL